MIKEIILNNKKIKYDLHYKNVKNINLRIKKDGSISVSANITIPLEIIESFILSKADMILKSVEKCKSLRNNRKEQFFSETEIRELILTCCEKVYPYFRDRGIKYPEIKFRKMVSQWGSCNVKKGILTFNTNLVYAPMDCIKYVVLHEFTHFLQPNHSIYFYNELEKVCPLWKVSKKKLKEIIL